MNYPKMNLENLTIAQRSQRMNICNFFLIATDAELQKEIEYRQSRKDEFAVKCLQELLGESYREQNNIE